VKNDRAGAPQRISAAVQQPFDSVPQERLLEVKKILNRLSLQAQIQSGGYEVQRPRKKNAIFSQLG